MSDIEHIFKSIDAARGLLYSWFPAMYSRVDIATCGATESDLKAVTAKICDRLKALERTANFFDDKSELTALNNAGEGEVTTVSEELLSMLYLSKLYNTLTDGRFDVCIKSDNYNRETIKSVNINLDSGTVTKHSPGIRFDLSGFLKGYALDESLVILRRYGIADCLLSIGNSSVLALGNHPYGNGWRVARDGNGDVGATLFNECLTTSGNADESRRHIVSPADGGIIEGANIVSVVTRGGAEGEALATAMFVERDAGMRERIVGRFREARLLDVD